MQFHRTTIVSSLLFFAGLIQATVTKPTDLVTKPGCFFTSSNSHSKCISVSNKLFCGNDDQVCQRIAKPGQTLRQTYNDVTSLIPKINEEECNGDILGSSCTLSVQCC